MLMNLTLISHQLVHLKGGFEVRRPNEKKGVFTVGGDSDESVATGSQPKEARKRIVNRIRRNYQIPVTYPKDATPEQIKALNEKRMSRCNELIAQLDEDLNEFVKTGKRIERTIYKKRKQPHFTYIFENHETIFTDDVKFVCFDKLPYGESHSGYHGVVVRHHNNSMLEGDTLAQEAVMEAVVLDPKEIDALKDTPYPVGLHTKDRMMYSRKALNLPEGVTVTRQMLEDACEKKGVFAPKANAAPPPSGKGNKPPQTSNKNKRRRNKRKGK